MISRRTFCQISANAGIVLMISGMGKVREAVAQALLNPNSLTKYIDPLPIPGVMQPVTQGGTFYEVGIYQKSQQLHSQLPPTTIWGYGTSLETAGYPANTFEVRRGVPIHVKWSNYLDGIQHPLPVDQTLHWADPQNTGSSFLPYTGPIPTVAHVHGCEVESQSDGNPDAWFTPGNAITGSAFKPVYDYSNQQPPCTLWYHDHAMGITRLNVYMGLAGFYIIRDPGNEPNLPSGSYEIPIVIQDRMFNDDGSFSFPNEGINPDIHPFWGPEFFGDTILVNGKIWPYLDVEPRRYRFRILNGSNARFYNLSFSSKQSFFQIGTDGGYLSTPVELTQLLIAPGERADVIVDFTGMPLDTVVQLTNDANAPYPDGDPVDALTTAQIMQFRVSQPLNTEVPNSDIPTALSTVVPLSTVGAKTRTLTLNEVMGPEGPQMVLLNNTHWDMPVTEMPVNGSTEIWEIINMTEDTHPIHLHLVQYQLLSRQQFDADAYNEAYSAANPTIMPGMGGVIPPVLPYLQGNPMPPDPNETGWKDTYRMNPDEVTRVIIRFAPYGPGAPVDYPFDVTAGPGYVWHCHIIDHEDNEMMRPYKVIASTSTLVNAGMPALPILEQNYPNPFNPTTQIRFHLPAQGHMELVVYNTIGQEVRKLADGSYPAGSHNIIWNGKDNQGRLVSAGIYLCQLRIGNYVTNKKMILMK